MDILAQKKFMTWVIAILIILNVSTLTYLWISRSNDYKYGSRMFKHDRMGQLGDGRLMKFFKSELNLTDEQTDSILELRNQHHQIVKEILKEIHYNKKLIVDGIFLNETVNVDSIANVIGEMQSQIEILTFDHLNRLKSILGPDQKESFKKLVGGFFLNVEPPEHRGPTQRMKSRNPDKHRRYN